MMQLVTFTLVVASLLTSVCAFALEFKAVSTNANALIQQWHKQELQAQGGEFGSHGWWPWGVGGFDYDNDGDVDLYLSHHGTPGGKLLVNQLIPSGVLEFKSLSTKQKLPGADDKPWFFDFNGDGWLDIAAFSDEKKNPYVINKQGEFNVASPKETFSPVSYPKTVTDLNQDGYLDLDAGRKGAFFYQADKQKFQRDKSYDSSDNNLLPLKYQQIEQDFKANNKKNRFFRATTYQHFINRSPIPSPMLAPIDLNNDQQSDIIVAGHGGYGGDHLGWYFLASNQGYTLSNKLLKLPEHATPIYVGDLNGDHRQDLITTGKGKGDVYLQTDKGFVKQNSPLSKMLNAGAPYLVRVFAVDFDNDRDLDLLLSNPRKKYGKVWENDGKGRFKQVLSFNGWDSNPVFITDLNNDLRQDIVIGGASNQQLQIFLNTGQNQQNSLYIYPRYKQPNPYAVDAVVKIYQGEKLIEQQRARWDGLPLVFSLGKLSKVTAEITFSDGTTERYQDLVANHNYTLIYKGGKFIGHIPANLVAQY